jgi:hypothetical protein
VQRESEEEAWRAIVENYGERVELDDEPEAETGGLTVDDPAEPDAGTAATGADPGLEARLRARFEDRLGPREAAELADDQDDADRFVPPTPPPMPKLPADRLAAWAGLFGSPLILLICLIAGIGLPHWAGYLLVAAFIGGFVYLVVKMPRGPADPWDDGARL